VNKKYFIFVLGILAVVLFSGMLSSYLSSNPQTTQFSLFSTESSSSLSMESKSFCQEGTDFLVELSPFDCSPAIVRSDLLEENNVPVYCKLSAIKVNPLIDVKSIEKISFSGKYSPQVAGVTFFPAKSALGTSTSSNSQTASLDNIGYVVIMLKKQSNESAMPDFVVGNLTAKIKYNVETAFGIGSGIYYLPEFISDDEWEKNKNGYSFWNGKGYLQADNIEADSADISIYDANSKVSTVTLKKGETSNSIYLPGFECQAGLKATLQGISNPDTRARLRINSDVVEVADGETFLNNKCTLTDLNNKGLIQDVTFKCKEDSKTTTSSLVIAPKVVLNIGGVEATYSLGDRLYRRWDKEIYLGYIGVTGGTNNPKNLFIFLYAVPSIYSIDKLSNTQLRSISSTLGNVVNQGEAFSAGPIKFTDEFLKSASALIDIGAKYILTGEDFQGISVNDGKHNLFGQDISVVGFAETQDTGLTGDSLELYNNANQDYDSILESYAEETYGKTTVYGEEALYQQIALTFNAGQKKTTSSLCDSFKNNYPNSKMDTSSYCSSVKLSNPDVDRIYVTINKQTMEISLDGIYAPTLLDYGVYVNIENAGSYSGQRLMQKKQKIPLSDTEYIALIDLDDNTATFDVSGISGTVSEDIFKGGKAAVNLNDFMHVGKNNYKISLTKINLKKVAKVSLKSNIDNTGTQANFSFKIGIEKRANLLSPSVTKALIGNLSKSIEKWQKISDSLNSVNKFLKTSCVLTGGALVLKNFVLGADGTGIARQQVMSGKGGWSSICEGKVAEQEYISLDQCYNANSDKIDADVANRTKFINAQNDEIKKIEEGVTNTTMFGEKVVDTKAFMTKSGGYIDTAKGNIQKANCFDSTFPDPSNRGESINTDDLLNNVITADGYAKKSWYSVSQLRDIELYCQILGSSGSSDESKNMAKQSLYSTLYNIQSNSAGSKQAASFDEQLKIQGLSAIGSTDSYGDEKAIKGNYNGGTINGGQLSGLEADKTYPAKSITYNNQKYVLVLESSGQNNYFINKVYDGNTLQPVSPEDEARIKAAFSGFQKYDSSTYKNAYKNPKIKYYETAPYAGLPAIVPFDRANGWYASISQTVSTGNNIASYADSGRVTSFWVCNVGQDGLEQNKGGDDICEMINTGTGQPYNQFPGLSEADATKTINKANKAIEQASKSYSSSSSGKVKILDDAFDVGTPAVDIPDFQCQDFMSPNDCLLLFNICDPVICPSSRCDLGGTYPVKDVVQQGIIGSIALCFPNVREGIIMPVCLTGVQAGVDGLISIQRSYRDCLNASLTTGQTVGICDEMYSIYLCDFFWKQALPIAKMIVPSLLSFAAGQNVRGGGEYLSVASAWGASEKAVNYLVNYYGANAKSAFAARSTEMIQNEVCKLSLSGVVPNGGDFFDNLIQSDSPAQFTARFDEMPLSTATNPTTSQYKIYYHIYAGKDSGAYYQVYLKGNSDSTYYKDTSQSVAVDSGYIAVGSEVDKTKDTIAISGYKQLCLNVNGQEECGFKQVSTSFAINYATETYTANQASETDIKTSSDCVSGTANIYSLLVNLNPQAAAQSLVNPSIYNQGIIRVCATLDPGKGTDSYTGTENSRWKSVGYCDDENIKCWIDTESIKSVLRFTDLQNGTLTSDSNNYNDILTNQYGYLTEPQFDSAVQSIEAETDNVKKVSAITAIIEKVFLNKEKAKLLFLRGNAYGELFKALLPPPSTVPADTGVKPGTISGTQVVTTTPVEGSEGTTSSSELTTVEISKLSSLRQKVINAAASMIEKDSSTASNCWDAVYRIYKMAGAKAACVYSDNDGKKYNVGSYSLTTKIKGTFQVYGDWCVNHDQTTAVKLDYLQPGDIISYTWVYSDKSLAPHNAIFIKWIDKDRKIAQLFDWNGGVYSGTKTSKGETCGVEITPYKTIEGKPYCKLYRYYDADLSDTEHPVYVIFPPSESEAIPTDGLPAPASSNQEVSFFTASTASLYSKEQVWDMIYKQALRYADANSGSSSLDMVLSSLKAAGITDVSGSDYSSLASSLKNNPHFYEVEVSKDLQKGDIIFIADGCNTSYSAGIVTNVTNPGTINYLGVYANLRKTVGYNEYVVYDTFPSEKLSGVYPYRAYRYIDSSADRTNPARNFWTAASALEEISTKNLKGSYNSNRVFMDQLVFDGILNKKECDTMDGGLLNIGQKDITWLKALLISKTIGGGKNLIGEKIYAHAKRYADSNSGSSSLDLVISALKAGGITSISGSDYSSLASSLKNNPDFYEVNIDENLQKGDIILIGDGCNIFYSAGIAADITVGSVNYVKVYTNLGKKVELKTFTVYSNYLSAGLLGTYPYKAYRYVGDLTDADKEKVVTRVPWTVSSALSHISINKLTGSYSDNKAFIDALVFDGVLTQTECSLDGNGMTWVEQILSLKNENGASSIGEKISAHAKKYADTKVSTISSIDLATSALKAAGIPDKISNLDYASFVSSLNGNSNFYEVDMDETQKTGDIILIAKGCKMDYSVGIISNALGPSRYMGVYTNLGSKVTLETLAVIFQISSGAYPYKAYRYVGDLTDADKKKVVTRVPWTATSALNYIQSKNLKGNYGDNKLFMDQLVFDGILTQKECDTMDGGLLNIGQKDITWLKTLLLSKQATSSSTSETPTATSSVSPNAEKIYTYAKQYADINSGSSSLDMVTSSLKAGGVTGLSSYSYVSNLDAGLRNNPNLFYQIDVKNVREGDIIFLRNGCKILDNVGIVGLTPSDSNKIAIYSNFADTVTLHTFNLPTDVLINEVVPYKAYRYVGDLSDTNKNSITQAAIPFNVATALKYISDKKLSGSYSNNKKFMNQLVFDGVLTTVECSTMTGGMVGSIIGTGQKDIAWLQRELTSKLSN
jgi:hypothetical protein